MLSQVKKALYVLVILGTTSSAALADSVDVKVIGTIMPTACRATLGGGGTIDYGIIKLNSLKKDGLNQLDHKQLDFSITCDTPAKLALKPINNRPNTVAGSDEISVYGAKKPKGISGDNGGYVLGLGLANGKKIGGYGLTLTNVFVDSQVVDYLEKKDSSYEWQRTADNEGNYLQWDNSFAVSWALPGTLEPLAFTALAGKLDVQAYVNKTSELDLSKPIQLDGLTTLELVYL